MQESGMLLKRIKKNKINSRGRKKNIVNILAVFIAAPVHHFVAADFAIWISLLLSMTKDRGIR